MARMSKRIMNALSALNAVSDPLNLVDMANINEITYYFVFSAGVSAGALQVETAHDPAYTGTWSPEGTPIAFGDNAVKHSSITGVALARRVRISTGIVGGTVSIWAIGR